MYMLFMPAWDIPGLFSSSSDVVDVVDVVDGVKDVDDVFVVAEFPVDEVPVADDPAVEPSLRLSLILGSSHIQVGSERLFIKNWSFFVLVFLMVVLYGGSISSATISIRDVTHTIKPT